MKKMIAMVLCSLMLTACGTAPVETTEPVPAPLITVPVVPETIALEHYLTVYAPNEDATGFIYASVEVPEYSPEAICNVLICSNVLKEDVRFNSIALSGKEVLLDVNEAFVSQLCSYGTAGEYMMMGSVVNTLLSAYDAETVSITMEGQVIESGHVIYDFPLEFYEDQTSGTSLDLPPMVRVRGQLYIDTGMESTITARCGMMDGIIDSQVDPSEIPAEDSQSNFGIGYGYQFGPEPEAIEVNIDGTWWVFANIEE